MKKVKTKKNHKASVKDLGLQTGFAEKNVMSQNDSRLMAPGVEKSDPSSVKRETPVLSTCHECSQKEGDNAEGKRLVAEKIKLEKENTLLEKNVDERFRELATLTLILDATEKKCQLQGEQLVSLEAQSARLEELALLLGREQEKANNLAAELSHIQEFAETEKQRLEAELAAKEQYLRSAVEKIAELDMKTLPAVKKTKTIFSRRKPEKSVEREQSRFFRQVEILRNSGLFDSNWYLQQYPDVSAAKVDPVEHYLRFGADELRDPSPFFSTAAYSDSNPDVVQAKMNCLVHYLCYGRQEGRPIKTSTQK